MNRISFHTGLLAGIALTIGLINLTYWLVGLIHLTPTTLFLNVCICIISASNLYYYNREDK